MTKLKGKIFNEMLPDEQKKVIQLRAKIRNEVYEECEREDEDRRTMWQHIERKRVGV